jgi:hypothetical protein
MNEPLASNLRTQDHLTVFGRLFAARMAAIPLQNTLVCLAETVPAEALETLAGEYHILGYEGWLFATTEAQKREVLRKAILVHKLKGTPWSIKEACLIAGFPGVYFQEGVDRIYDGTLNYDGSDTYGSEGWARVIAFIPVSNPLSVPGPVQTMLTQIIMEYKPQRCEFEGLTFVQA